MQKRFGTNEQIFFSETSFFFFYFSLLHYKQKPSFNKQLKNQNNHSLIFPESGQHKCCLNKRDNETLVWFQELNKEQSNTIMMNTFKFKNRKYRRCRLMWSLWAKLFSDYKNSMITLSKLHFPLNNNACFKKLDLMKLPKMIILFNLYHYPWLH